MTAETAEVAPGRTSVTAAERRSTDVALARLHLRLGSLSLARAEFETLAGRGPLDDGALVDLAEVRWRTGDTILGGEAATTALEHGLELPLALIITAEAAVAIGRPGEARRLATRAMSAAGGTLDALFAGMPRSAVWPPDPADPAPLATTLFGEDKPEPTGAGADPAGRSASDDRAQARRATDVAASTAAAIVTGDDGMAPGLWDGDGVPEAPVPLQPAELMEAGLAALGTGDPDRAASLLGLAVRTGPHLAPAILDGTIDVTQPGLLLVRGDAFRAVGSERKAAVAYAAAAQALGTNAAAVPDTAPAAAVPDAPDATMDARSEDAALQSGPTNEPSQ